MFLGETILEELAGVPIIPGPDNLIKGAIKSELSQQGVKKALGEIGQQSTKGGAKRAAQYASEWGNSSLKDVINRFAPGSKGVKTSTGKTIYNNRKTGIQVVYDDAGNYFRIENVNLTGKRRYLDLEGNVPNNKVVDGKASGRSQAEYNQETHFNDID